MSVLSRLAAVLVFAVFAPPASTLSSGQSAIEPSPGSSWAGTAGGTAYFVQDSIVRRTDGTPADAETARALLAAERLDRFLLERALWVDSLADCRSLAAVSRLLSPIGGIGATTSLAAPRWVLADGPVQGLLGEAADALDAARARCEPLLPLARTFQESHAVEDGRALTQAFSEAIPAYDAAADRLDELSRVLDPPAPAATTKEPSRTANHRPERPDASQGAPARSDLEAARDDLRQDAQTMRDALPPAVPERTGAEWALAAGAASLGVGAGLSRWLSRRR